MTGDQEAQSSVDGRLSEVLEALDAWDEVEVFHKTGRSRSVRSGLDGVVTAFHQEEGWAVRAGDARRSFFHAATGPPDPGTAWPEPDGWGLRLPSAKLVPAWTAPVDLDAPLIGENEARAFFEVLARELGTELPGARLFSGALDDGSSTAEIASSREVRATSRHRAAALVVEAEGPKDGGRRRAHCRLRVAEREARRFHAPQIARRLADRLQVLGSGTAPPRDRGELLLAPPVITALLDTFSDLWLGPGAIERAHQLIDRRGRIASPAVTLIDDGRLSGGALAAAVDGEGQPTREIVLVEEGHFRQPLLAWWQATPSTGRASGCARRPSWRDLPRPGPTHLYLKGDPDVRAAELVENLSRGYYLLDTAGPPRREGTGERFAVPVCGFAIDSGRPTGSLAGAWLVGSISSLLHDVTAAARDLSLQPSRHGLLGAPTLQVKGLEIRRSLERPRWVLRG